MSDWPISLIALILLAIVQCLVTGQFMGALFRDDPDTYKQVANPVDLVANTLGPMRFRLLYMIPNSYENWSLSSDGLRFAFWLRFVSILSALGMLGFCVELIFWVL